MRINEQVLKIKNPDGYVKHSLKIVWAKFGEDRSNSVGGVAKKKNSFHHTLRWQTADISVHSNDQMKCLRWHTAL